MLFTAVAVQRNAACKLCGVALGRIAVESAVPPKLPLARPLFCAKKRPQLNALPTACLRPVHARRSGCGSEVFFRAGRGAELPPSPARFSGCSALLFSVTAFELYLSYHPRRRLSSRRRVRPRAQSAFRDRIAVLYNKTTWKSRCHSPIIKMYETIFYPTLEGKSWPTPRF